MGTWLKRLFYLFALVLGVGTAMLITMPVQFMMIQWGLPETIRVGAVSGTLQSGRASELVTSGKFGHIDFREHPLDASWQWCPGWSRGIFTWCVDIASSLVRGRGRVSFDLLSMEYRVLDTVLRVSVQEYPVQLKGMRSNLEGTGFVNLEELRIASGGEILPVSLAAEGELEDLAASGLALGNYLWSANLEPGGMLTADFSGGKKDMQIKGQMRVEMAKSAYRYRMEVATQDSSLRTFLQSRARRSAEGSFILSGNGSFQP